MPLFPVNKTDLSFFSNTIQFRICAILSEHFYIKPGSFLNNSFLLATELNRENQSKKALFFFCFVLFQWRRCLSHNKDSHSPKSVLILLWRASEIFICSFWLQLIVIGEVGLPLLSEASCSSGISIVQVTCDSLFLNTNRARIVNRFAGSQSYLRQLLRKHFFKLDNSNYHC